MTTKSGQLADLAACNTLGTPNKSPGTSKQTYFSGNTVLLHRVWGTNINRGAHHEVKDLEATVIQ